MEAADLLCDSLFRWLENQKECEEKLLELVQELEKCHQESSIARVVGAAASMLSIKEAAVATGLKKGLAAGGTAVSVTPTLRKPLIASSTFNKAIELFKENDEVGKSIQKQLRDLKHRCGGAQLGDHADELECEVTSQLMCALARRDKTHVPLDFLRGFNRATFFRHLTPGGLDPAEAESFICRALNLDRVPVIKSSLKVLDVIGLDGSLNNLIMMCEKIVERKRIPGASKIQQDSPLEIQESQKKLKEQLDAMQEIIQKLFRMKNLITNLRGYSLSLTEDGQKIVNYIMGTCTDSTVVSWLRDLTHQIEFVNLLRFSLERLSCILPDLSTPDGGHIDIVFVAHGSIVDQFMPAGVLVPTPTIIDTILYSPWNCKIDSNTAFGIAQGFIQVTDREFYNTSNMLYYEPNPLPDRWNNMRGSLHDIPVILLSPVTPEEGAWTFFHQLWRNRSMEIEDRVIIPYLVPQDQVKAFGEIPLFIFIFVTSFMLRCCDKTATVHLAACLGRAGSPEKPVEWRTQYAYTSDETHMTMNMDDRNMNPMLFEALTSLFDRP
ncbi:uncharacterized protein [Chanodichthys erythropterus]|uniref:uncharacterized protein n=1 Tax=Chanodichthys erythropterus TaxID=933992 RepID=UPI00351DF426